MPASMDEGWAWMVVVRAYTICLLDVGQRLDGAAVHLIVLPRARRGKNNDQNLWIGLGVGEASGRTFPGMISKSSRF